MNNWADWTDDLCAEWINAIAAGGDWILPPEMLARLDRLAQGQGFDDLRHRLGQPRIADRPPPRPFDVGGPPIDPRIYRNK